MGSCRTTKVEAVFISGAGGTLGHRGTCRLFSIATFAIWTTSMLCRDAVVSRLQHPIFWVMDMGDTFWQWARAFAGESLVHPLSKSPAMERNSATMKSL